MPSKEDAPFPPLGSFVLFASLSSPPPSSLCPISFPSSEPLLALGKSKVIFTGFFFLGCGTLEDEEAANTGAGLGGGATGASDSESEPESEP